MAQGKSQEKGKERKHSQGQNLGDKLRGVFEVEAPAPVAVAPVAVAKAAPATPATPAPEVVEEPSESKEEGKPGKRKGAAIMTSYMDQVVSRHRSLPAKLFDKMRECKTKGGAKRILKEFLEGESSLRGGVCP